MRKTQIKAIIIIFSIFFGFRVCTLLAAEYFLYTADKLKTNSRAIEAVDAAISMDSTNAGFYFHKYDLLEDEIKALSIKGKESIGRSKYTIKQLRAKQLDVLKKCINLCPSWASYHMYYAYTLKFIARDPNVITRERILSQLKKATQLKPKSKLYRRIYKNNLNAYKKIT